MCSLINTIFLIALMVESGLAIHCFTCDSSTNKNCADLSDSNIIAEECTYGGFYNQSYHHESWLMRLSEIDHFNLDNIFDLPLVCQKLVGIDGEEGTITIRRCQLEYVSPCNLNKYTMQYNRTISHCSVCEADDCNTSSNNEISGMLIGVATAIITSLHIIL